MPLYDYRCKACGKRFTMMVGVVADEKTPACPSCSSDDLSKLIGRFSAVRSEDQILDDLSDIDKAGDLDDPKKLKTWVREMGKSMDEDLDADFEEMLEEDSASPGSQATDNTIY